jgi:predicted enzyme related to lactoylglutathione lyase
MRLSALALVVPGYAEGLAFFTALGFTVTADVDQGHKRWVTLRPPGGGPDILLARADTARQAAAIGDQAGGRVFLFLQTDDFARDARLITAAGGTFEEPPRDEPYGRVAVWRDPFGNRWDLIQPA